MIHAKQNTRIITHTRYSGRIFRGKKNGIVLSEIRRSLVRVALSAFAALRQLAISGESGRYSMKKENSAERLAIPG